MCGETKYYLFTYKINFAIIYYKKSQINLGQTLLWIHDFDIFMNQKKRIQSILLLFTALKNKKSSLNKEHNKEAP